MNDDDGEVRAGIEPGADVDSYGYSFGGTLTRSTSSQPVCKHLLACILMGRCPGLVGEGVRVVSVEELAGLCAGWGG